MAAENATGSQPREAGDDRSLGRWEWVALPELGIACMKARLAADAETSLLASVDRASVGIDGMPGMGFRIYPLADDERTFVLAEAPLATNAAGRRGPRIRTLLTLGERSWPVELELVSRASEGPPLTLGQNAFDGGLRVDSCAGGTAGPPRIWPEPFDPDAEDC